MINFDTGRSRAVLPWRLFCRPYFLQSCVVRVFGLAIEGRDYFVEGGNFGRCFFFIGHIRIDRTFTVV